MTKPRLLDLYCGAGGAGMGYHRAGFDVVGVDIQPQPNYPFTFVQGDALTYAAAHAWQFDAIHASPPCQAHSWAAARWRNSGDYQYPDLVPHTRWLLESFGLPYVIENVLAAPLREPMVLCGTMFGLKVFRHRKFESNEFLFAPGAACKHKGLRVGFGEDDFVTCAGHGGDGSNSFERWKSAMGIDWMTKDELVQSIPPAYTEWIGRQLLAKIQITQLEAV